MMVTLAALAIFSGLSINLILSFALGAAGAAGEVRARKGIPFFQLGIMFISILFLWILFTIILPPQWRGFSEYFLFFPLSALVCMVLERLGNKVLPKSGNRVFNALTGYDGLVPVSLLITLSLAGNFLQVFVLALFFVLGNLVAMLILFEIRRRSTLEKVPAFLRGSPLILISMGLLSLITGTTAVICFRILEMFYG